MSRCSECGGSVVWDEDAASTICESCGILTDPSQHILADNDNSDSQYFNPSAPNTLKRFRGGSSWNLSGPSKEDRVKNNTYAMHDYIKSLTVTLSVNGLSPRVCALFDQAMRTSKFRWGTKAKMVAGACLSIALRESGRPDLLKDIAFLIQRNDVNLKRTLFSVLIALNLTLTPAGPAQYLPTLQSHLSFILNTPVESSELSISLYSELKSLSLPPAAETAQNLIDMLACFTSETSFFHSSPSAVACAVFIMSLEAEKRDSLSRLAEISASFANQCQVTKTAVMHKYQALQEEVVKWTEEVDWLDSYRKVSKRAKVSKRLICARGLKEALKWKHNLWEERIKAGHLPNLDAHLNSTGDSESESDLVQDNPPPCSTKSDEQPSQKKRKVHLTLSGATDFLLDPVTSAPARNRSRSNVLPSLKASNGTSALSCYLLSAPSDVRTIPSRLQQLSVARGGVDPDIILDDELLADGEWETIQRSPEEIQKLEQRWRDEGILDMMENAAIKKPKNGQRRTRVRKVLARTESCSDGAGTARYPITTSSRIDLDAFSQFMQRQEQVQDDHMLDLDTTQILGLEFLEDEYKEDKDVDEYEYEREEMEEGMDNACHQSAVSSIDQSEGEILIDDWRPPSPGLATSFDDYYL